MVSFNVLIAGVSIKVNSQYGETKAYFSDFLTNQSFMEVITISMLEIENLKKRYPHFSYVMCEKGILKEKLDKVLVKYNVFAIHASSLGFKDYGYVFTALSGVGKSTHARKWREAFDNQVIMINDDRTYLKVDNNKIYAFSHPQAGKHGIYNNVNFPVQVIARIVRDDSNYVKRVTPGDFFPFMVQQSFTTDTPLLASKIIKLIKTVIENVSIFEIHCNEDDDAGKKISEALDAQLNKYDKLQMFG